MTEDSLLTSPLEYTNEPYAIAKIAGLKMCESFNLQYGTNYIAVMPTNLYGPNDNFHLENSHVLPAMIRKIYLAKCLNEGDWEAVRKDIEIRPVSIMRDGQKFIVDGLSKESDIIDVLAHYGITNEAVTLWGTGAPMREFLWSEEMADASVHVLLNVDFKDTYKDNLNADNINEIRNCHINVGTGKEISIKQVALLIMKEIGFRGELRWDSTKPDGTLKKLTDVTKLHALGWHHKIEIDEGIHRLYQWYLQGICINHRNE
jgi:GDP-L-fucose synthase